MKLFLQFTALGLFASGVLGQAARQPCSANATLPCACPNGTQYAESGTWVILGTGASDVRALMADCKFVPRGTTTLLRVLLCRHNADIRLHSLWYRMAWSFAYCHPRSR